jgi:hypothetical protein
MRCDRLTGPDLAHFARRVVANSESEIRDRGTRHSKLVPTFGAYVVVIWLKLAPDERTTATDGNIEYD